MSIVASHPWTGMERYRVRVEQYKSFRQDGYLIVKGLVLPQDVEELLEHTEQILSGEFPLPGHEPLPAGASHKEIEKRLLRIHMMHRHLELWERYLLYPRLLDVLEVLYGPDILAMQTMLFTKGPGANGQGWHQDTYYIPTFPDSLIGAWIAIDPADMDNGCLCVAKGSQHEPIYPPKSGYGFGDWGISDITEVSNVGGHSNSDEDPLNTLKPIAERYEMVSCVVEPGDVVFFAGHVIHRSFQNRTTDRYRRSLVNHYCNARSFTSWDEGNHNHILARGNTHMPFAKPKFGTPCAAMDPKESLSDRGASPTMMMAEEDGMMGAQEPGMGDHDH
ncbi:MAG TPA: phytanoyl-CoA dioxygenase family protein [Chthoniobacteraceae bacterium]|nr:phytanoyl-CoA dioxygenase family protein [Chthoniobacteraceae bacterium]